MQFDMLKRPAEFKRLRGGGRHASPLFIVEGRPRTTEESGVIGGTPQPRFGFTITRKVGTAVVRNRIRRRLKEALRALDPACARPDYDYVVVASLPVRDHPFADLKSALALAFETVHRGPSRRNPRKGSRAGSPAAAGAASPLPRQRKSGKATASIGQTRPAAGRPSRIADATSSTTPDVRHPKPADS